MTATVQLYVYDLSNGLARQLSLQLTGKQLDGIWHTSVVVFGKEVFYGQGISITQPCESHHGRPLKILDMGPTSIDEATFEEYLNEIREHYTAVKYHLLDFNCNSFTNDCIGFLTGGSIPSWIKDLPTDFLSTPFGAALRPTIDRMFTGTAAGAVPRSAASPAMNSLLDAVASRATRPSAQGAGILGQTVPSAALLVAPLQVCTNLSSFKSLLAGHKAVIAYFTSQTCPPCRVIGPIFESLAKEKATNGATFVKIDLDVGLGSQVAQAWSIRVTPTFLFFLDGQKVQELKGANVSELKTQIDLLLFQAFPPHPHTSLDLPAVRTISLDPILFSQVPALNVVESKLISFIDGSSSLNEQDKVDVKRILVRSLLATVKVQTAAVVLESTYNDWTGVTKSLIRSLRSDEVFPLFDIWRLAILNPKIAAHVAANPSASPIQSILNSTASSMNEQPPSAHKSAILTTLKMTANMFSNAALASTITHSTSSLRRDMTSILVLSLLHADTAIRTASASLAFNIAAHFQKPLIEHQRSGRRGQELTENMDSDWIIELTSAVAEALQRESRSAEVVHRLTAALAFYIHLSPFYENEIKPLLEVLQVKETLISKLEKGKKGDESDTNLEIPSADVKKLIKEVSEKLCV